eukprot:g24312.t1
MSSIGEQRSSNPDHTGTEPPVHAGPWLQTVPGFTLRIMRLGDRFRPPGRAERMPRRDATPRGHCARLVGRQAMLGSCCTRLG